MLRNGTVYGYSPRMRFDLVVNTFVKDALLNGKLLLHGGGWMWRPLVDVRDVSDAMIAAFEAPAEKVRGEIFNVLHSNYQIRELAMLVAGSVQLTGRTSTLDEEPAPAAHARLRVLERQALDHARLHPAPLGASRPSRDILARVDDWERTTLTDPRGYNIRWLELLNELKPQIERSRASCERASADHRRGRPARLRPRGSCLRR